MKVVLLNPPYFKMFSRASRSPAVTKSSTLYYPFFLSYATGVLEDAGFDAVLIDAPAAKLDRPQTIDHIRSLSPDIVFCETSTPSIENDLEVMRGRFSVDLDAFAVISLDAQVCDDAAKVAEQTLCRSLDAIHLAAARRAGSATTVLTFDRRQAQAARSIGLSVIGC